MDFSCFLRRFFSCATVLAMLAFLPHGAALAEDPAAPASSEDPSVVDNIERDAEEVGNKVGELGDSVGNTAGGIADSVATEAEKAYEWSKQKGSEAYVWSKKQIHDLTQ